MILFSILYMRLNRTITITKYIWNFFFFIVIFFICFVVIKSALMNDIVDSTETKYNLDKDGVTVLKEVLTQQEIEKLRSCCFKSEYKKAKNLLIHDSGLSAKLEPVIKDSNYQLQDYIMIIQKSSFHTCHRDNNGDFFNKGQNHPSYTLLIILEPMEKCLGVIPQSHKRLSSFAVNFTDQVINLVCQPGDAILFNANLIHVGAINDNMDDHLRIQMKVSHKDDLNVLEYYQDFNKVLNESNTIPRPIRRFQRNMSCMFPFVSNMTQQENIRSARGSDNGATIGLGQQAFSSLFYGNSKYFDLPNAF